MQCLLSADLSTWNKHIKDLEQWFISLHYFESLQLRCIVLVLNFKYKTLYLIIIKDINRWYLNASTNFHKVS